MTNYDILVIGAGPAGLMAAGQAARAGRRVLLIDGGRAPGGCWTSLKKGRFTFELRPVRLRQGPRTQQVMNLLREAGAELDWTPEKGELRLFTRDGELDAQFPAGVNRLIETMAGFCQGSRESVEDFFELAQQTEEALTYLESTHRPSWFRLMRHYPNFLRCAGHNVDEVLTALNMPPRAANCLKASFNEFGCDCGQMNFAAYASALLEKVEGEMLRPEGGSYRLMLALESSLLAAGGEIWYHSPVEKLLTENGRVTGARLTNGYEVRAGQVIADADESRLWHKWLKGQAPEAALKAEGAWGPGAQGFAVFLGLNRTAAGLGIRQETILIQDYADSAKEATARGNLENTGAGLAVCLPLPEKAGKGCTLALYGLYAGDPWSAIGEEQYEAAKNVMAAKMVRAFEKACHVHLNDAVEEAWVAGPAEYARLGGGLEGQVLSHTGKSWQAPFIKSRPEERQPLPGLTLCSSCVSDVREALLQGAEAARLAAGMEKEAAR